MENINFEEVDLIGEVEDNECRFCPYLMECIGGSCLMEGEPDTAFFIDKDGIKVLFK